MGIPHKHADIIKAWADGAEIQLRYAVTEDWEDTGSPAWCETTSYRVKPKPPVKKYQYAYKIKNQVARISVFMFEDDADFLGQISADSYDWFERIEKSVQEFPAK